MKFIGMCICSSSEKCKGLNHAQKPLLVPPSFPCHLVNTALLLLIYIAMLFRGLDRALNNTFVRVLMQENCRKEHFQNCLWGAGYSQC